MRLPATDRALARRPCHSAASIAVPRRLKRFGEEGVEEAAAGGGGGGEARFQLVAQRHQRIDLGDNAVLLGERREGNAGSSPAAVELMFGCAVTT